MHHRLHEFLTTKSWLNCHYQNLVHFSVIYQFQNFIGDLSFWFDTDTDFHVTVTDHITCLNKTWMFGFIMKGDTVGSCLFKFLDVVLRMSNHNMTVKMSISYFFPERLYNWRTECKIWNKVSIHYVNVKTVCSIIQNVLALCFKIGKVS